MNESKLTAKQRREIPLEDYGIPSLCKYPMPDKSHVESAIRMFNHVDDAHEKELAGNVIKKMRKYGISFDTVGPDNRLKNYL